MIKVYRKSWKNIFLNPIRSFLKADLTTKGQPTAIIILSTPFKETNKLGHRLKLC
jgi:hypothetical protein